MRIIIKVGFRESSGWCRFAALFSQNWVHTRMNPSNRKYIEITFSVRKHREKMIYLPAEKIWGNWHRGMINWFKTFMPSRNAFWFVMKVYCGWGQLKCWSVFVRKGVSPDTQKRKSLSWFTHQSCQDMFFKSSWNGATTYGIQFEEVN